MEIKSVIFCTLDGETDLIIQEVFELLPSEIKEFHRHISYSEKNETFSAEILDVIKEIKGFGGNDLHSSRHFSTGRFNCDFFILSRNFNPEKTISASSIFKDMFYSEGGIGEYDEILFNFSDDLVDCKENFYSLTNYDSHGNLVSDELLFDKIKYFFLFFLTSDLNNHDLLSNTIQSFYFSPNPTEKYFKTIALEYDGLPIFTLRGLYHELLKERYLRQLLEIEKEINPEFATNKVKKISSLVVEELKTPDKPQSPLSLSFWSTKKGRKEKIQSSLRTAEYNFRNYDLNCHDEAKKQRIELESKVNAEKQSEISNAIIEIVSSSRSITQLRLLFAKLLDKNGALRELIAEKEKDISWPEIFHFGVAKFSSNHPNWIIISILSGLFILPEIIDYLVSFPKDTMIWWNILIGLILAGYTIFSIFNIKDINKKFNEYHKSLLQKIEKYYKESFLSLVKYLEIHILKLLINKIESTDIILMKNQVLVSGIYLSSYQNSENYNNIQSIIENELNKNPLFAEKLKPILLNSLNKENILEKEIDNILLLKDPYESCLKLIRFLQTESEASKLVTLTKKIASNKDNAVIIKLISREVGKANLVIDSSRFVQLIEQKQLDEVISHFIKNQNFDNLLSVLKSEMDYSAQASINRLLDKKHSTYYLSKSQDNIDSKEMLFSSESIRNPNNITEYRNLLKVICGYLKIVDLKVNERNGGRK